MWKRIITFCELILIPAMIVWITLYADRKYYLLSSAALFAVIVMFVISYEARKPEASEVVLVAVICGLTVVCRAVFIMIPQLMPASAIIIISGMALGPQQGFLIGSMSMFVSNFYAGQGPWTVWQMFAYGLLGYMAGVLYRHRIIKNNIISTGVYAVIMTMLVVGPILDTCTLCTMSEAITLKSAITIYAAGIPVNIIHTIGAVAGLILMQKMFMEKLDRIKIKYGMVKNEI